MATIQIRPAGMELPKTSKLAKESIEYVVDVQPMLDYSELVIKATVLNPIPSVIITDVKSYKGMGITLRITNKPLGTSSYEDHIIALEYLTTLNNKRIAQFSLRVHK